MFTTVADLITTFRADMQDMSQPYLWTDAELLTYVNEGLVRLFQDVREPTTTVSVTIAAGERDFPIPTELMMITGCHVVPPGMTGGDPTEVVAYNVDERRTMFTRRASHTLFVDSPRPAGAGNSQYARLSTTFEDDYSVVLTGTIRLPTVSLTTSPLPTRCEENPALLSYVKFRALGKQDAETFDKNRAQEVYLLYREQADRLYSSNARRTRPAGKTRYGGL